MPMASRDLALRERIDRLVEQGIIEPLSGERLATIPPPIPVPKGVAQRMLQEDRDA